MNVKKLTWYRIKKVIPILIATAFISSVFGNGCSQLKVDDSQQGALCSADNVTVQAIEDTLTASVVSGTNIIDNLKRCTQYSSYYEQESQDLLEAKARRDASFPEFGSVTEITGPMMMGVVDIAGTICADLIDANADLFQPTDDDTISALSLSCWGYNADSEERNEILNAISDLNSEQAKLFICTSILSSTSAVVQ
ncbi:MAG: hypothetical protein KDD50_00515 [Bdellovibrionales bacterium]|nr:hypothetical protein [Bdellovibrionales bacterium]